MPNYCIFTEVSLFYSTLQCANPKKQGPKSLRPDLLHLHTKSSTKQGPPTHSAKTFGWPTLNSTTRAYSEAAWGITTAPGPRCWSTAVRTYQKNRLCHGSRLVVKNGSPRRRETWRPEQEAGPRRQRIWLKNEEQVTSFTGTWK